MKIKGIERVALQVKDIDQSITFFRGSSEQLFSGKMCK